MKIEILGADCTRCAALKTKVLEVVAELDVSAEVVLIVDPERLAELQVMSLPVLLIDGEQRAAGTNVSTSELKKLIQA